MCLLTVPSGHVAEARPLRALASGLGDASTPCVLVGAALVSMHAST